MEVKQFQIWQNYYGRLYVQLGLTRIVFPRGFNRVDALNFLEKYGRQ